MGQVAALQPSEMGRKIEIWSVIISRPTFLIIDCIDLHPRIMIKSDNPKEKNNDNHINNNKLCECHVLGTLFCVQCGLNV